MKPSHEHQPMVGKGHFVCSESTAGNFMLYLANTSEDYFLLDNK
jgi:hypothetical protein